MTDVVDPAASAIVASTDPADDDDDDGTRRFLYVCLDATDDDIEQEILGAECTVRFLGATSVADLTSSPEALELLANADVVAVWHTLWLDAAVLALFPQAKAVIRMGVGYDNVDVDAAAALGIAVCNVPDYGTEEVADSALALILGLYRGTLASSMAVAQGARIQGADGIAAAAGGTVRRVRGSRLGLVGLGRIGTAVAVRAKAFGFQVHYYDPAIPDGMDKALDVLRCDSIEQLFDHSDCISLHANNAPENERMVSAELLARVPEGCVLVNTARGELVDEEALAAALLDEAHPLAAAALDVHWNEPYLRGGASPLADSPNLFCTPHMAWYSPESRAEMRVKGATNALAACRGEELRNVVNAEGYFAWAAAQQQEEEEEEEEEGGEEAAGALGADEADEESEPLTN